MKMSYETPIMDVEQFMANEYFAACGTSGVTYKFKCDAGNGVPGNVWEESNGVEGLQTERKWVSGIAGIGGKWVSADNKLTGGLLKTYSACGVTHEAESTADFVNGYYRPLLSSKVTDVVIWTEGETDVHCTTNLDRESWETGKS